MRWLRLFPLLFIFVTGPAIAQPSQQFDDAMRAFMNKNYTTAARLLLPLAEQGHALAQTQLGGMYNAGRGVEKSYHQAAFWYRKAAEQGNQWGQYSLGTLYAGGLGVPQDYVLAHMWFNLAAAGGNDAGASNRDNISTKMTPAQIAEAQRLAREWKPNLSR